MSIPASSIQNRSTPPCLSKTGFTLLEVLVSLVITGMVIAVFFQIMSSGLRLEYNADKGVKKVVEMDQAFKALLASDVRDRDFQWEGESDGSSWTLLIQQVDTEQTRAYSDDTLHAASELYRYIFKYKTSKSREWTLVRYVQHEPGFFDEDFKRRHFQGRF